MVLMSRPVSMAMARMASVGTFWVSLVSLGFSVCWVVCCMSSAISVEF